MQTLKKNNAREIGAAQIMLEICQVRHTQPCRVMARKRRKQTGLSYGTFTPLSKPFLLHHGSHFNSYRNADHRRKSESCCHSLNILKFNRVHITEAYSLTLVVPYTYCAVFLLCFSSSCVPMLPVSLDCHFLIVPSVFSNVYLETLQM